MIAAPTLMIRVILWIKWTLAFPTHIHFITETRAYPSQPSPRDCSIYLIQPQDSFYGACVALKLHPFRVQFILFHACLSPSCLFKPLSLLRENVHNHSTPEPFLRSSCSFRAALQSGVGKWEMMDPPTKIKFYQLQIVSMWEKLVSSSLLVKWLLQREILPLILLGFLLSII